MGMLYKICYDTMVALTVHYGNNTHNAQVGQYGAVPDG